MTLALGVRNWNQGTAPRRIAERGWSVVVLRQGPSSVPDSQAALRQLAARFDTVIRANGAREMAAGRALLLQEAAQEANAQFGRR
jgi:hypothetical protein